MAKKEEFIPDPSAAFFGSFAAIQAVLRALVQEHPDPARLLARLHDEKESSLAFLMNSPCPEAAIDVFESTIGTLIPNIDHPEGKDVGPKG